VVATHMGLLDDDDDDDEGWGYGRDQGWG